MPLQRLAAISRRTRAPQALRRSQPAGCSATSRRSRSSRSWACCSCCSRWAWSSPWTASRYAARPVQCQAPLDRLPAHFCRPPARLSDHCATHCRHPPPRSAARAPAPPPSGAAGAPTLWGATPQHRLGPRGGSLTRVCKACPRLATPGKPAVDPSPRTLQACPGALRPSRRAQALAKALAHEPCKPVGVALKPSRTGAPKPSRRAQALAKYAFGLGLLQMIITTAAFTVFSLPVGSGVGTIILEKARPRPPSRHGPRAAGRPRSQGVPSPGRCLMPARKPGPFTLTPAPLQVVSASFQGLAEAHKTGSRPARP